MPFFTSSCSALRRSDFSFCALLLAADAASCFYCVEIEAGWMVWEGRKEKKRRKKGKKEKRKKKKKRKLEASCKGEAERDVIKGKKEKRKKKKKLEASCKGEAERDVMRELLMTSHLRFHALQQPQQLLSPFRRFCFFQLCRGD